MVTVIIVNYNNFQQISDYITRITDYAIIDHIIVVDNASTDESLQRLNSIDNPKLKVINSGKNGGYGYGNNFGIRYAVEHYGSDYALISNADVFYEQDVLVAMESVLSSNDVSVVAAKMKTPEGMYSLPWKIPHSGISYILNYSPYLHKFTKSNRYNPEELLSHTGCLDSGGYLFKYVDCVPGSLLMVNTKDFTEAGGYDESIFLYCEEMILGIRLRNKEKKTALLLDYEYLHDHKMGNKELYQQTIKIWDSREILLNKYFHYGTFRMSIASAIKRLDLHILKNR